MDQEPKVEQTTEQATDVNKQLEEQIKQSEFTVEQGAQFLKQLSEFTTKKDELMKRLGSIGDRMQKRMRDLEGNPGDKTSKMAEGYDPLDPTRHPHHSMTSQTPFIPAPLQQITYTRIRETPQPTLIDRCFSICFPAKKALDEEWFAQAAPNTQVERTDEGLLLKAGGSVTIPTGLKIGLPPSLGLYFTTISHLAIAGSPLITAVFNEKEICFTVTNVLPSDVLLLYGTPLFTGIPVQLATNLTTQELLNSTYDDWVHGSVQ